MQLPSGSFSCLNKLRIDAPCCVRLLGYTCKAVWLLGYTYSTVCLFGSSSAPTAYWLLCTVAAP